MKRLFFFALTTLLFSNYILAQDGTHIITPLNTAGAEVFPEYDGGLTAFYDYIRISVKDSEEYKGKMMMVNFTVETDGNTANVKILKGLNDTVDDKVTDLIKHCKKWTPGVKDGRIQRLQLSLPIRF